VLQIKSNFISAMTGSSLAGMERSAIPPESWNAPELQCKPHYVAGKFMLWVSGSSCFLPLRKVIGMHFYQGLNLSVFQPNA